MQNPILDFWQANLWRCKLNHIQLSYKPFFEFTEKSAFEESVLQKENGAKIWVAPINAHCQLNNTYWIPFWIPLQINENKLCLSFSSLPWMPPVHTESFGMSPFAGAGHFVDEFLRYEWLDEDKQLAVSSWHEGLALIEQLLDEISNGNWQQWLKQQSWQINDKYIVIDEQQLNNDKFAANTLCTHYAFMDEFEAKHQLSLTQSFAKTTRLCSQSDENPFSIESFISAIHCMLLKPGDILAIQAVVGSAVDNFMDTITESKIVHAYLSQAILPSILKYKMGQLYHYQFKLDEQKADEVKSLMSTFEQGLAKVAIVIDMQDKIKEQYEDSDTQETIEHLQAQDEIYEKQLIKLLQLQMEFVNKKKRHALVSWLLPSKKTAQKDLKKIADEIDEPDIVSQETLTSVLFERIRQIKVARTKIHRELADLVEQNTSIIGAKNRWHEWFRENISQEEASFEESIILMQSYFAVKTHAIGLVQGQWQAVDVVQESDLLFVQDAQRLLPQQLLEPFSKAQTVVCLGDNQDITTLPLMSWTPEEWELATFNLNDEITVEQLQYKGMMLSTGNVFNVALSNSAYQEIYDHGVQIASLSLSYEEQALQYHSMSMVSKSGIKNNQYVNEAQAEFIVQKLLTGELAKAHDITAIITPFVSQKELIERHLKAKEIDCEVYTFDNLPFKQWQNIIFSPVYSAKDQRPFVFDQGENMLYSLKRRAINHLWVIGDLDIFDARMHSPSGNLAKKLFKTTAFAQ
ncbi:MAG: AAA domain-containing protein [Candidatus Berkiella sp.]